MILPRWLICLLVEMHQKVCAPAACSAGLFAKLNVFGFVKVKSKVLVLKTKCEVRNCLVKAFSGKNLFYWKLLTFQGKILKLLLKESDP